MRYLKTYQQLNESTHNGHELNPSLSLDDFGDKVLSIMSMKVGQEYILLERGMMEWVGHWKLAREINLGQNYLKPHTNLMIVL